MEFKRPTAAGANYQDSWIPGLQEGLGGFGIMWTSDGLLHHDGVSEDTYTTFDRCACCDPQVCLRSHNRHRC